MASPSDLTPRQRRIVDFISETVRARGYPPTVREIGEAVGLTSSSSVHAQLATLERRGLLRKDATKPRAMQLSEPRVEGAVVPLVGRIAAGAPILADEHVEDHLTVPMGFVSGANHFALRVRGDSMVNAGILDGDVVIVRETPSADDGDIVAALLPGPGTEAEATIKRLKRRRGKVMLVPDNDRLEPFEMDPEGSIAGVVVAVLRKL
jgi:repressor LexA